MRIRIRYIVPLACLAFVPRASAAGLDYVKCAVNQDRVWVYESLNSFDVEARLKCGESVDIISRVRGFVKVRTASGVEGYIADSAFPDLPALPDDDKPSMSIVPRPAVAAPTTSAAAVPVVAPKPVAVVEVKPAAAVPPPAPIAPVQTASAPNPAPVKASEPVTVAEVTPAKAPVRAKSSVAVIEPAPAKVSTASTHAKPATAAKAPTTTVNNTSPSPSVAHNVPAPPVPVPAKASVSTISVTMRDNAEILPASRDLSSALPPAPSYESDEYPDAQPENESADPACHLYFSAYGLAPAQYKWLAENRRKQFSQVCPAPDPSRVDYVILFAHDSDNFAEAMPALVHIDRNGFSDFSPMTTVDTALVPASELGKTRFESVWVFRVKRGDFDPARFSPRRRPQFTNYAKGARASSRSVEDAFNFIETQSPSR
jgi:hypothetical protein